MIKICDADGISKHAPTTGGLGACSTWNSFFSECFEIKSVTFWRYFYTFRNTASTLGGYLRIKLLMWGECVSLPPYDGLGAAPPKIIFKKEYFEIESGVFFRYFLHISRYHMHKILEKEMVSELWFTVRTTTWWTIMWGVFDLLEQCGKIQG